MFTDLITLGKRVSEETGHYAGGNARDFEKVGRHTFQTLLANGLLPSHRVLDFGCGSLRNGYWLIRFLDPGNYFGAFGVPFDYVIARSILSHACPGMLHRMLDTFARSSPDCTFFVSYWRHDIAAKHGLPVEEDWTFHPINQQIWLKFQKQAA